MTLGELTDYLKLQCSLGYSDRQVVYQDTFYQDRLLFDVLVFDSYPLELLPNNGLDDSKVVLKFVF